MTTETTILRLTNVSGTSFTIDVSGLALSADLTAKDFEVTHAGAIVTNSYTKTSQTQITYAGTSVVLGTIVQVRRNTSLSFTESTFFSLTTAAQLTNSLTKLKRRVDECEAWAQAMSSLIASGGITLGSSPVFNEAYPGTYLGDITRAATRDNIYSIINRIDAGTSSWSGTYNYTSTANVNAALAASVNVPTVSATDSSTKASSTAQTQAALDNRLRLLVNRNTASGTLSITAYNDLTFNNEVIDRDNAYNPATFVWTVPTTAYYRVEVYCLPIAAGGTLPTKTSATAVLNVAGVDYQIGGSQWDVNYAHATGIWTLQLTAGQAVKFRVYLDAAGGSGYTYTFGGSPFISYAAVYKVS